MADVDNEITTWLWNAIPVECTLSTDDLKGESSQKQPTIRFQVPRQSYLFLFIRVLQSKFLPLVRVPGTLRFSCDEIPSRDFPWHLPIGVILDRFAIRRGASLASLPQRESDSQSSSSNILPLRLTAHFTPVSAIDDFCLPVKDETAASNLVYSRLKNSCALTFGGQLWAETRNANSQAVQRCLDQILQALSNNEADIWLRSRRTLRSLVREAASRLDSQRGDEVQQTGMTNTAATAAMMRREVFTAVTVHVCDTTTSGSVATIVKDFRVQYTSSTFGDVLQDFLPERFREPCAFQAALELCRRDGANAETSVRIADAAKITKVNRVEVLVQGVRPLFETPFEFLAEHFVSGDLCLHVNLKVCELRI